MSVVRVNPYRAELAEDELVKRADNIWYNDPGLSRTEALRKARHDNPGLYRALQRA
jgi:hypothetical protein